MKLTYKYRIYPLDSQITKIKNIFSMCRHLYNWNLQQRIEVYEKEKRTVTYSEQQDVLPDLKKERPWFKHVYSQVLQDVLKRLDKAYQRFFNLGQGFPKYKKKGQWNSITYPQYESRPENGMIDVPKVGKIKLVYHRPIPMEAEIKTLTLIQEGGKWFACFSVELPDRLEPKPKQTSAIGIDLGLNSFIYSSNGEALEAPRYLRQVWKKLKRLQRKLSRLEKRTTKYFKTLRALQKVYYRLRCKRTSFFYEQAHRLFEQNDIVIVEDLDIGPMTRRPDPQKDEKTGQYLPNGATQKARLNASIYDVGWGMFLGVLKQVANKLGKQVVTVEPAYTTQSCSACGTLVKKGLSERTHRCPVCGYTANRDYNAAKNILRLGLESLGITLEAPTIMRSI
jgi:putative transposase